jgi:hypothetical protein
VVTNYGPAGVASATVQDSAPAGITFGTWSCSITTPGAGTPASACDVASGSGNVATTVTLAAGGVATYVIDAQIAATATGDLVNTATEALPAGVQQNPSSNNADAASATIAANDGGGSVAIATPTLGWLSLTLLAMLLFVAAMIRAGRSRA